MNSKNATILGLGIAIALVLSAGAVYGIMGQAVSQRGTYAGGMMASSGYRGGIVGGGSTYSGGMLGGGYGGMMGSYPAYQGYPSGMMTMGGSFGYPGGMMTTGGYDGMMGRGMMGSQYYYPYSGNNTVYGAWRGSGAFVAIVNYGFYPADITVPKGATVTWVNMDFVQHTVTAGTEQAPTNLFDSHELNHMQSFSYTFSEPGTYTYYCDIHPNMIGTVTVTG